MFYGQLGIPPDTPALMFADTFHIGGDQIFLVKNDSLGPADPPAAHGSLGAVEISPGKYDALMDLCD